MPMPARTITADGLTLPIDEWSRRTGVPVETIRCRIDRLGWEPARAVNTPADRRFRAGGRPKSAVPRPCPRLKEHPSGRAYVVWWESGRRHYRYFGAWGSADAATAYRQFAAEWAAGGSATPTPPGGVGVAGLVGRWLDHCEREYRKNGKITSEVYCCRSAARPLVELYGDTPAAEFTPKKLKAVRAAMVAKGWARKSINLHCSRLIHAFKWGAAEGLVPAAVHLELRAVSWLKQGRGVADPPKRTPAPDADVAAVLAGDHLHPKDPARRRVLADLIRVQSLTGMRPGEVVAMLPEEIDRGGDVWVYEVGRVNKNLHRDKPRRVAIGPRAAAILAPYLAAAEPGRPAIRWPSGTAVAVDAYGKAIRAACVRAGVEPWTPHQLRHALATRVAIEVRSLDHAAAAIGDDPATAAAVYVHVRPQDLAAIEVARRMG